MSDEPQTIAQTAARLGISERTLRRALRAPELQAKLVAISRHIGGRERHVSLVNALLYEELRMRYFSTGQQAKEQAAASNLSEGTVQGYERLIEEQAQRIRDLLEALAHERQQTHRLVQSLSEAQERLVASNEPPPRSVVERLFGRNGRTRRQTENS